MEFLCTISCYQVLQTHELYSDVMCLFLYSPSWIFIRLRKYIFYKTQELEWGVNRNTLALGDIPFL